MFNMSRILSEGNVAVDSYITVGRKRVPLRFLAGYKIKDSGVQNYADFEVSPKKIEMPTMSDKDVNDVLPVFYLFWQEYRELIYKRVKKQVLNE